MSTITTDTATMTPAEIDTVLAENWGQQARLTAQINHDRPLTDPKFGMRTVVQASDRIAENTVALRKLQDAARPFETEFTVRGGWHRYFVVRNAGGHVHRSMHCNTCYPTTTFGWLPELSDCDEAAMVAQYGEMACTVCFPDAPTFKGFGDGTSALARYSADEKAERAKAKADRDAKKAAKTLDTPVRVSRYNTDVKAINIHTDRIETVAAAKSWIKGCIDDTLTYHYNLNAEAVADGTARLTDALAAKGIDVAPMIAKWTKAASR